MGDAAGVCAHNNSADWCDRVAGSNESQVDTLQILPGSFIPLGRLVLRSGLMADVGVIGCSAGAEVVPAVLVEPYWLPDFDAERALGAFRHWVGELDQGKLEWPGAPSWGEFVPRRRDNLMDWLVQRGRKGYCLSKPDLQGVDRLAELQSAGDVELEGLPSEPESRRDALDQLWWNQPWLFCAGQFHVRGFVDLIAGEGEWPVADLSAPDAAFVLCRAIRSTSPFLKGGGRRTETTPSTGPWRLFLALQPAVADQEEKLLRRFIAAGESGPRDPAGLAETFKRVRRSERRRVRNLEDVQIRPALVPIWSAGGGGTPDDVLLGWLRSDAAARCLEVVAGGHLDGYSFPLAGGDWQGFLQARCLPLWRSPILLSQPDTSADAADWLRLAPNPMDGEVVASTSARQFAGPLEQDGQPSSHPAWASWKPSWTSAGFARTHEEYRRRCIEIAFR